MTKICTKCGGPGPFYKLSRAKDGLNPRCKFCCEDYKKDFKLLLAAQRRAKRDGLPCTITRDDIVIPECCPVLRVKLVAGNRKGPRPDAPSLDRIDPKLGYIPGNVQVISHMANSMKRDATAEQLISFADWVYREVMGHGED